MSPHRLILATRRAALARLTLAALLAAPAGAQSLAAQATDDRPWGYGIMDFQLKLVQPLREWMGNASLDGTPFRNDAKGLVGFLALNGKEISAPKFLAASPLGRRRGFSVARDEKGWRLVRSDGFILEELKPLGKTAPTLRVINTPSAYYYVIGNDEFVTTEDGEVVMRGVHNVTYGGVESRDERLASTDMTNGAPTITYYEARSGRRAAGPFPMRSGDADVGRYAYNSGRVVRWNAASARFGYADARDSIVIALQYVDARPFESGVALVVDSANGALRTSIIDIAGKVRASLPGAGACLSSFWGARAFVCFPDRVAMIDTSGREVAHVARDYEFDASAPSLGGLSYWLHRRTPAGTLEWTALGSSGRTDVPSALGAHFSEVLPNGAWGWYIVRGYESQRTGMALAATDAKDATIAAEAAAVAAGNARVHSGHGLQRMNREDEPFARPPEFFPYLLVRAYVNKKIVGAPSASDYASSVVTVWAEKDHGTMPDAELAAAAGCKTPDGWALAYSGIVVPKDARSIYDSIKQVYRSVLRSDTVLNDVPCAWGIFRQTF